ncbi:MAG: ABC transporter substrate-binding protein [Chloroflexi bacterium]|nr:ABC transporter substrate-binding protein [Chloroflexota bacterium]
MTKKITWLVVSGLMILVLVLSSCAPASKTLTTPTAPASPTTPTALATPTAPLRTAAVALDKPKYGGELKLGWRTEITYFDTIIGRPQTAFTYQITNETLWSGDWARGPAGGYGSNELSFRTSGLDILPEQAAGHLAESWEFDIGSEVSTITFHIRKGIRWALNPNSEASRLVNGRELTADDVASTLKTYITDKRSYVYVNEPRLRTAKITAADKWTVKIEVPTIDFELARTRFGEGSHIVPPEVVQKYGDMRDWKNSIGTGPFILTDFVSASSATLVRNPNYWMKDPIGPGKGNQLPYLDGVKFLVMPDQSTLYAALRTAKIDRYGGYVGGADILWEDAALLKKQTPQLMVKEMELTAVEVGIALKINKSPFNDTRVRRAMMLAIDFERIKKEFFGGNAKILTWPVVDVGEYAAAYLGLDDPQMPASVKELYSYNPEKAKALLKEAGYPQGFKTNIVLENRPAEIYYHEILADMWSKVGINVELRLLERAPFNAARVPTGFDQMIATHNVRVGATYDMRQLYGAQSGNMSEIDDPVVKDAYEKIQTARIFNRPEAARLYKELMKHVLDQVWAIPRVATPKYLFWWPWIKNYSGEESMTSSNVVWYKYVWLDEQLKKSMGY